MAGAGGAGRAVRRAAAVVGDRRLGGVRALFITLATLWLRRFERGPLELVWQWAYTASQSHLRTNDKVMDNSIKR
ncbi:DUF418 domain-containing protein [Streptosporangium canum]|uniref:DUF418 domain-containing protein n=1 Tax=Streptosporangium canum TaxID=324952 RepID=UPI00342F3A51